MAAYGVIGGIIGGAIALAITPFLRKNPIKITNNLAYMFGGMP